MANNFNTASTAKTAVNEYWPYKTKEFINGDLNINLLKPNCYQIFVRAYMPS